MGAPEDRGGWPWKLLSLVLGVPGLLLALAVLGLLLFIVLQDPLGRAFLIVGLGIPAALTAALGTGLLLAAVWTWRHSEEIRRTGLRPTIRRSWEARRE